MLVIVSHESKISVSSHRLLTSRPTIVIKYSTRVVRQEWFSNGYIGTHGKGIPGDKTTTASDAAQPKRRLPPASIGTYHKISSDPIKPTTPKVKKAKAIPKAKKESWSTNSFRSAQRRIFRNTL